jgi:uncharacterized membrane protein YdbT with pleckstrin-like domain
MSAATSATAAELEVSSIVDPVGFNSPRNRPPERIVYISRLHWRRLIPGLLVTASAVALWQLPIDLLRAWATVLSGLVDGSGFTLAVELVRVGTLALLIVGLSMTLAESVVLAVTRLSVTDRTLMLKTGALKRRYFELSLDRVEAITVSQSMLARLLNYGTVVVAGTGSTREVVRCVARPHEFRRHVMEQSVERRIA